MYFFSIYGPRITRGDETEEQPNPFNNQIRQLLRNVFTVPNSISVSQINENTCLEIFEKDESEMLEEGKSEEMTCVICHLPIREKSIIRRLNNCNHFFHVGCIDQWITSDNQSSTLCPICRQPIVRNSSPTTTNENTTTTNENTDDIVFEETFTFPFPFL